jgi:ketosteroid isomerase-like protein
MADGLRKGLSAWEEFRTQAEEYSELDGEHILGFIRGVGRGKTSGLKLDQMQTRGAHLFQIRDGKVTRLAIYFDHPHALADLGLAPEAGSPAS